MRLIEKRVPCGESRESRKGIYVITDSFYKFWFRYKFTNNAYYEMLGADTAAKEIMGDISNLMGDAFETICMEYMVRLAKKRKLPFVPGSIGKWWGNNPAIKEQDDVDILLINEKKSEAIFVECKFISKKMPMSEYDDLVTATLAFSNIEKKYMMFISKSGYEASVINRAKKEGTTLLTINDLFTV